MNRLTRITSILIQLQSKKVVTAKEIADRFEISLRTVYRDIKTLQEAGVPIGSENGIGYFIVDGYSLPPIMITEEEANALIVSEKLISNQGDKSLTKDFNSVLIKIKSVLRSHEKENVAKLESRITPSYKKDTFESNWLSLIQKSITNTIVLEIVYHSIYKDELTLREVEPLGVYYTDKAWIMIAHCKLRNETREFRLDRILKINSTLQIFDYQQDFSLLKYFSRFTESS
ncbi:helix-turn-helix transcriptional regulator [Flavivirga rizhaonensis]|uniref:YafY family transcriptional regulator n=1 Tax=Flavivirga rizhaonensis TaxID=2559571 RepID=A0A4S1E274_9FLAO|nr:YafY family protein [Flavivirga rizhaonensis]TGV04068.1 YafY family transcriptional regulator [Flavivirga rizhaonensis]